MPAITKPAGMALLEQIRICVQRDLLKDMALIGVQHLFETTASFLHELLLTGINPGDVHILGKSYSAIPSTVDQLVQSGIRFFVPDISPLADYHRFQRQHADRWLDSALKMEAQHDGLIILDEGGDMLRAVAARKSLLPKTCGVEQTRYGLGAVHGLEFPVIQVADSALKRFLEPPIIAKEIFSAASAIPAISGLRKVGVIGVGSLGTALAKLLLRNEKEVFLYDASSTACDAALRRLKGAQLCNDVSELLSKVDVCYGCTGSNALKKADWEATKSLRARHFISCSSGDVEFHSLLAQGAVHSPALKQISDVPVVLGGNSVTVYNGGYPINFNRKREMSSSNDIQLTRALLLGGVFQAAEMLRQNESQKGGVMLSPNLQRFVAERWFSLNPQLRADYDADVLNGVENIEWLTVHSGGTERHSYARAGVRFS